jgi:cytoskeleton protein RodZ
VGGSQVEAANAKEAQKASLGESLVAARQRRGLSRETVVQQAHIPAHYVQMLEEDDYRRISDQLYLLPFLRKYANFLDIDPDETAMRLLREVQRVENSPPPPARLADPLDERRYRRRNLSKPILFSGLIAVLIGAYIAQSRHEEADTTGALKLQSVQRAVASPPSASGEMVNPPSAVQSVGVAASEPNSVAPLLRTSGTGTRASTLGSTLSATRVTVVPMTTPEPPSRPHGKTPIARQRPNP